MVEKCSRSSEHLLIATTAINSGSYVTTVAEGCG